MGNLIIAASQSVRANLRPQEVPPQPVIAHDKHGNHTFLDRKTHGIGMRCKDAETKYSVDNGKCRIEYVDEYIQGAADYELSSQ